MWIYIIGYIVSFVILYFIYKIFNDKFTYGMLAQTVSNEVILAKSFKKKDTVFRTSFDFV